MVFPGPFILYVLVQELVGNFQLLVCCLIFQELSAFFFNVVLDVHHHYAGALVRWFDGWVGVLLEYSRTFAGALSCIIGACSSKHNMLTEMRQAVRKPGVAASEVVAQLQQS